MRLDAYIGASLFPVVCNVDWCRACVIGPCRIVGLSTFPPSSICSPYLTLPAFGVKDRYISHSFHRCSHIGLLTPIGFVLQN